MSASSYPFYSEYPREKKYVKFCLDNLKPGECIRLDLHEFHYAFTRIDSAMDLIWGPSRTTEQVFQDEYPDLVRDLGIENGSYYSIYRKRRETYVRKVRKPGPPRQVGVWEEVDLNDTFEECFAEVDAETGEIVRYL